MSNLPRCANTVCNKEMVEGIDYPDSKDYHRLSYHESLKASYLCNACFALFDGQKMRGRFRMVGIDHMELVSIMAQFDQMEGGGPDFNIGHPSEEFRYTESVSEWIKWQVEKAGINYDK